MKVLLKQVPAGQLGLKGVISTLGLSSSGSYFKVVISAFNLVNDSFNTPFRLIKLGTNG